MCTDRLWSSRSILNGQAHLISGEKAFLASSSDFLDIMANVPVNAVVIGKEHVSRDFFDLSTGLAGEILQKASNYHFKIALLGDFKDIPSRSLKDFIFESNRTGRILFVDSLEEVGRRWNRD